MAVTGTGIISAAPAEARQAPIVVLVDSLRLPMVKAYEKANPGVKLDVELGDAGANGDGSIESKVALANRVGHGWPDIIFSAEANDVQKLGAPPFNFPAALNQGLVPNSIINNYASGALSPCMVGGKLECLRNDLAFDVLWVNVPLMKKWGYTVPTTWQQWQVIGENVAKNHPGYVVGSIGDSFDDSIYLQAARCPINDELNQFTLLDNPADPHCTGMAKLLDPLLKDGVRHQNLRLCQHLREAVRRQGAHDGRAGVVLGRNIPVCHSPQQPQGHLAAYPPLIWAGQSKAYTGDVGGGLWIMSSHTTQPQAVAIAARRAGHFHSGPRRLGGLPGVRAGGEIMDRRARRQRVFRLSPGAGLRHSRLEVWTGWPETPWDVYGIWASTVLPNLTAGQSFSSQLAVFGARSRLRPHCRLPSQSLSRSPRH